MKQENSIWQKYYRRAVEKERMTLLWRFKSVSNRVLKTTDPCNTHALNVPISYRMEPWFSSRKKNPGGWQERNVICVQVKTLTTMVKMISIVRTVILCLAVCDVCWTRYLALDDDTEDSYLPETEVSLFTFCLFFVMYHYDDNISVCYEFVKSCSILKCSTLFWDIQRKLID